MSDDKPQKIDMIIFLPKPHVEFIACVWLTYIHHFQNLQYKHTKDQNKALRNKLIHVCSIKAESMGSYSVQTVAAVSLVHHIRSMWMTVKPTLGSLPPLINPISIGAEQLIFHPCEASNQYCWWLIWMMSNISVSQQAQQIKFAYVLTNAHKYNTSS